MSNNAGKKVVNDTTSKKREKLSNYENKIGIREKKNYMKRKRIE